MRSCRPSSTNSMSLMAACPGYQGQLSSTSTEAVWKPGAVRAPELLSNQALPKELHPNYRGSLALEVYPMRQRLGTGETSFFVG